MLPYTLIRVFFVLSFWGGERVKSVVEREQVTKYAVTQFPIQGKALSTNWSYQNSKVINTLIIWVDPNA